MGSYGVKIVVFCSNLIFLKDDGIVGCSVLF